MVKEKRQCNVLIIRRDKIASIVNSASPLTRAIAAFLLLGGFPAVGEYFGP